MEFLFEQLFIQRELQSYIIQFLKSLLKENDKAIQLVTHNQVKLLVNLLDHRTIEDKGQYFDLKVLIV